MLDVIIIGMGCSGCMASSLLDHYEKNILCIEAMDRIGGRVHTARFGGDNNIVEMGAEWMHGTCGNSVKELAVQAKVQLIAQKISYEVFTSDGHGSHSKYLTDLVDFTFTLLEEPSEYPMPLGQHIQNRLQVHIAQKHPEYLNDDDFFQNFIRWMNLIICSYESCEDWDEVTTSSQYRELKGSRHMSWHKHGYKTAIDVLMGRHSNSGIGRNHQVLLNTEVVLIKCPSDYNELVEVTCKDGRVFQARACIFTGSLGVLKEKHATLFSPPLPDVKVRAINALSIGVVNKVALLFQDVWWPTATSSFAFLWRPQELARVPEEDLWATQIFGASRSMANDKCLIVWISGKEAKHIETLTDDEVQLKIMWLLRKFMGKNMVIPEPIEIMRSAWYGNEFTRGSYSFDNLSTPEFPDARTILAEPLVDNAGKPRVMFAGEATDNIHFSTVHGALDSGKREANRFLSAEYDFDGAE